MLHSLLETEISIGVDNSNIDDLIKSYAIVSKALDDFLALKIDFETYCDILESQELDMDDYVLTIEENLNDVKA